MTTTPVENRFSIGSLSHSWENVKPTLKKVLDAFRVSPSDTPACYNRREAAYHLYKHFSGEKENKVSIAGMATFLRNDRNNAIRFFFQLSEIEISDLKEHFERYHSADSEITLPGFYVIPLQQLFGCYFPSVPSRN